MDHMPNLPIDVNEWSSRDVRIWLKAKGCDYSVQNKFFSERVDGEALLLLNTNDIHKLLSSYPFGYKVKISSYINQLRQHRYVRNNNSNQQTQHHAKPKSIVITSPSILPCTDNVSFTDNNSDAQSTEKRNKRANNASTIAMIENENDNDNESHDGNEHINKGKRNNYKRYTNDVTHSTRNHGKRWIEYDLDLMWSLHQKGCSNMKIAEHFKRTECGVMVQIDKKYKNLRANEKMKEIVELRRKNIRRFYKNRKETQSSSESESDSDDDDDEPVINNIRRNKQNKEKTTNNLSDNNANQ